MPGTTSAIGVGTALAYPKQTSAGAPPSPPAAPADFEADQLNRAALARPR